jgi:DNA-binding SARP family transcriptional activator
MSSFCPPVTELMTPSALRIEPRPRLFSAMDKLCASPILWVGGPPGCGKTASVAGYLSARGLASTWCCLNAESRMGAFPTPLALGDLLRRVPKPAVLVIEDCHQIDPAALSAIVAEAALNACSGVRLILIGRGEAPATLAPLIVKSLVVTLTPADLRLSFEEVEQWAVPFELNASALAQWFGKCNGWALGIARALEGMRRDPNDPMQAYETAKQEAFTYFAVEAFARATASERQLLVSAALVSRPSAQMTEALSGQPGAHEVLARIAARDGLFIRSTGTPPVYQFMPLFREFLLTRVADTFAPAELQALAMRAGALLEKDPKQDWLGGGELLEAYRALREGDRARCHQLLSTALADAHYLPEAAQVFAVFPRAVAQLCAEALRESIAPESARWLIERYRLPAPPSAGQHWPWPYKVYVLGCFRLLKADAPVRFSRRAPRKPLELLQALIAFGATEVPARALIDALWPDSEGDAGYHALESALYRLRHLLGAADAVRMTNSRLSLDRSKFWVDMWEFEEELRSTRRTEVNPTDRVGRIRQLYEGHFLEHEVETSWALKTRQVLRDRFLRYMRDAAHMYESRNLWREAATVYQSGLELDSLSEDLYRGLMVCHRELGDHSEALHAYRRCRELLTKFLGVPPNAKTQAVYFSVRERAVPTSAVSLQ